MCYPLFLLYTISFSVSLPWLQEFTVPYIVCTQELLTKHSTLGNIRCSHAAKKLQQTDPDSALMYLFAYSSVCNPLSGNTGTSRKQVLQHWTTRPHLQESHLQNPCKHNSTEFITKLWDSYSKKWCTYEHMDYAVTLTGWWLSHHLCILSRRSKSLLRSR